MAAGRVVAVLAVGLSATACTAVGSPMRLENWPLWETYARHFVAADGRVVEHSAGARSTSEGQAYALFFALVADDRTRFDRILGWTEDNLAQGDLRTHLPGWSWGRDDTGAWRLLDPNAASDADLWLVYTLGEAGRVWCEPRYTILAEQIARQVAEAEVDEIPGLGTVVLPGPVGFRLDEDTWRLNPSYLPVPLLRRLAETRLTGPWKAAAESTVRLIHAVSRDGVIPDWVRWHREKGFLPDGDGAPTGSYDAIRVYLWTALTSAQDPDRAGLLDKLDGLARAWRSAGRVPDRMAQGRAPAATDPDAPPGFYAVLAAWLRASGDAEETARVRSRMETNRHGGLYGAPARYYDQNLAMFAEGWLDGRFRFMSDGRLEPRWERKCGPY